jgi:uncharacterized protein
LGVIVLLSPAKSLNDAPLAEQAKHLAALSHTLPHFVKETPKLVAAARKLPATKLSALMHISDDLAKLNVARFKAWQPEYTSQNAKQAVLMFDGDVYTGLDAATLDAADIDWAQDHLCILSGLYGVLRPLDLMQPYRLEMGSALATKSGTKSAKNLYGFWGESITDYLNDRQKHRQPLEDSVFLNLASQEYFKAVKINSLHARVIDCVFEDFSNGQFKVVGFFAKLARGMMARYVMTNRIIDPAKLTEFAEGGYAYQAKLSSENRLVFRRKVA